MLLCVSALWCTAHGSRASSDTLSAPTSGWLMLSPTATSSTLKVSETLATAGWLADDSEERIGCAPPLGARYVLHTTSLCTLRSFFALAAATSASATATNKRQLFHAAMAAPAAFPRRQRVRRPLSLLSLCPPRPAPFRAASLFSLALPLLLLLHLLLLLPTSPSCAPRRLHHPREGRITTGGDSETTR